MPVRRRDLQRVVGDDTHPDRTESDTREHQRIAWPRDRHRKLSDADRHQRGTAEENRDKGERTAISATVREQADEERSERVHEVLRDHEGDKARGTESEASEPEHRVVGKHQHRSIGESHHDEEEAKVGIPADRLDRVREEAGETYVIAPGYRVLLEPCDRENRDEETGRGRREDQVIPFTARGQPCRHQEIRCGYRACAADHAGDREQSPATLRGDQLPL